jgi:hypothetical protein
MAITCGFDHEGQPLFIPLFKDPFPYVLVRSEGEPNNFFIVKYYTDCSFGFW